MLHSYTEHAAGFDDLELPVLSIPGLFISQKLVASSSNQDPPAASRSLSPPLSDAPITDTLPPGFGRSDIPQLTYESGNQGLKHSSPVIYSNLSLNMTERLSTTVDSETTSDYGPVNENHLGQSNDNTTGTRRLDPKLVRDNPSTI